MGLFFMRLRGPLVPDPSTHLHKNRQRGDRLQPSDVRPGSPSHTTGRGKREGEERSVYYFTCCFEHENVEDDTLLTGGLELSPPSDRTILRVTRVSALTLSFISLLVVVVGA